MSVLQVVDISGNICGAGPSELETGILIDCVRVVKKRVVYLNEKINFSLDIVSEGMIPLLKNVIFNMILALEKLIEHTWL